MMQPPKTRTLCAVTFGALLAFATGTAIAEDYPTRPVRIIVGFPPGGATDLVARILAPKLGDALKQQVVIDNRAGANGTIGAELAANATPDGYSLHLGTLGALVISPAITKVPYDPLKDFATISMAVQLQNMFIVHPTVAAKSIPDLIALAKQKPGALNYASSGLGSPGHLAGELFKSMANVKILHVPYKGAAPAVIDLISGHVQLSFISAPGAMPYVQEGRLRVLAVTNTKRSLLLPDIPTISEAGLKGYESEGWHGLFTPAGTPKPAIDRLYREISTLLRDQKINGLLAAGGAEPVGMSPEEFGRKLNLEIEKWAKVVKASGMKVD